MDPLQEDANIKDENADSGVDIVEDEDLTPATSKSPAWIDEDENHLRFVLYYFKNKKILLKYLS